MATTTPNRGYQLPAAGNKLKDDVLRLIAALGSIDADVAALLLALADKSNVGHGHGMDAITGLVAALGNKLDVGYHDALANLTDVDVAGVANGMALLRQASKWIPVALQINNIAGLETALNGKATPADITAAINALVAAAPGALDTLNELATALGNDPNFASTITSALGGKLALDGSNGNADFWARLKWLSKGIGEYYVSDTGEVGVDLPPQNGALGFGVWVDLTAGLTGAGMFNNGKLSGEIVTGSAPLVVATAVVSVPGSPMNGRTIRLLNTERRFIRAGGAGTIEADAMQQISGEVQFGSNYRQSVLNPSGVFGASGSNSTSTNVGPASGDNNVLTFNSANSPGARVATETRPKNVGARLFRRVG